MSRVQAAILACAVATAAPAAAESRSYVVSWFHIAASAYDEDCPRGLNPGSSAMYRRVLTDLGYKSAEVEHLMRGFPMTGGRDANGMQAEDIGAMRGRVDGKAVSAYDNPTAVPDPKINVLEGRHAYGFNLDGKPTGFEDPETGEKGSDNQLYRALGCTAGFRARLPVRPSYPSNLWDLNREAMQAWLITITGDNLDADGEVAVAFDRARDQVTRDSIGGVLADATFRRDPDMRSHHEARGRIQGGVLITTEPFTLTLAGYGVVIPRLELHDARLRLRMTSEGPISGYIGGYQPWLPLFSIYADDGRFLETQQSTDIPGLYYALARLADGMPDPKTGEKTAISAAYRIEAVPAFVVR